MARAKNIEPQPPYRETQGRFVQRLILLTRWEEAVPRLSHEQELGLWSISHSGWATKKIRDNIKRLQVIEKTRTKSLREIADSLPANLAGIRTQGRKPGFNTRLLFVRPRDIQVVDAESVLVHMTHYPEHISAVIKSVAIDLSGAIESDAGMVDRLLTVLQSGMGVLSTANRDLFGKCLKVTIDQANYRKLVRAGKMKPFGSDCIALTHASTKILPEVY